MHWFVDTKIAAGLREGPAFRPCYDAPMFRELMIGLWNGLWGGLLFGAALWAVAIAAGGILVGLILLFL